MITPATNGSSDRSHATKQAWPAPAKLNLFLHVTGRRPDGYHLLQTVFQFLDFGDALEFSLRNDGVINLATDYNGIPAGQDLVCRAAAMLQQIAGISSGADIHVRKSLPVGGGLGGGSSDAATTLVALNALWKTGFTPAELAAMGLGLGADVPVFIHGQAAWAEGIGEILTPVEPPEAWFVVAHPGINIATAEIFSAENLTRNTPAITIRDFLAGAGINDCERVVRLSYPEVEQLIEWLDKRAPARMTGTGACVFARCADEATARQICKDLPDHWPGFVARSINRSPLLDRVALETQ